MGVAHVFAKKAAKHEPLPSVLRAGAVATNSHPTDEPVLTAALQAGTQALSAQPSSAAHVASTFDSSHASTIARRSREHVLCPVHSGGAGASSTAASAVVSKVASGGGVSKPDRALLQDAKHARASSGPVKDR